MLNLPNNFSQCPIRNFARSSWTWTVNGQVMSLLFSDEVSYSTCRDVKFSRYAPVTKASLVLLNNSITNTLGHFFTFNHLECLSGDKGPASKAFPIIFNKVGNLRQQSNTLKTHYHVSKSNLKGKINSIYHNLAQHKNLKIRVQLFFPAIYGFS